MFLVNIAIHQHYQTNTSLLISNGDALKRRLTEELQRTPNNPRRQELLDQIRTLDEAAKLAQKHPLPNF